jgi:von Willebrand factor type A domain
MSITFLTPSAAVFAVASLAPLAFFAARERRANRIRRELGLATPRQRVRAAVAVPLALVPVLLALAAAQPVLESTRSQEERLDAEVFVVLDTSRSMLAAASNGSPTRFERAQEIATRLQAAVPEIPTGLASMTDRALPHLFPTTDSRVFSTTLREAMAVDRPPAARFAPLATSLNGLAAIPKTNFFSRTAERRMLVVLTDGETDEVDASFARAFRRQPRTNVAFVRLWSGDERIYETGVAESGYRPDPELRSRLQGAAELIGGRVLEEDRFDDLLSAVREAVGEGPTRLRELEGQRVALMPFVTLAAFVPLAFVLWRRNV